MSLSLYAIPQLIPEARTCHTPFVKKRSLHVYKSIIFHPYFCRLQMKKKKIVKEKIIIYLSFSRILSCSRFDGHTLAICHVPGQGAHVSCIYYASLYKQQTTGQSSHSHTLYDRHYAVLIPLLCHSVAVDSILDKL